MEFQRYEKNSIESRLEYPENIARVKKVLKSPYPQILIIINMI